LQCGSIVSSLDGVESLQFTGSHHADWLASNVKSAHCEVELARYTLA